MINFFKVVTESCMEQRKKDGIERRDMLQVLMELKDRRSNVTSGDHFNDQFEKDAQIQNVNLKDHHLDNDAIVGTSGMFISAGFDNSSATLSLIAYHLATNQDVQAKAREEVMT